ncbi:hypothetical protein BDW42DRAFT_171154 [Aspergillus taichungensis]|uniref:Early meiotic induction protein 1 n=1 Tax=Aspergillus taichungensis TaxID=482145 RepID=A0A2J5HSJ2_9EURO|nr:hypothetical protein BDW42DRAFT_171154 [Aspergillus taichungensis]
MGWLWKSSSSPPQENANPPSANDAPQPPTPEPRALTRDEQADAEFKQLLASLESDISGKGPAQPSPSTEKQASAAPSAPSSTPAPSSSPSSIAPESLYPDSMSCRSAFDYAFFCQSFGGQFVNVYRYGELRSCSEHWDNFWHCMKTRTFSDHERQKAVREHYRKKAMKYKTGPSSEDVWDMRMQPVRNAFQGDFAALEREMKLEEEAAGKAA